jgi:DNA-binding transcriptional regulator YiaG
MSAMRHFTKRDAPKPARIRELRTAAELSQSDAAGMLGVSLRTWQNWEAGTHCMHPIFWDDFCGRAKEMAR